MTAAGGSGGAILGKLVAYTTLTIQHCVFETCKAMAGNGGAIKIDAAAGTVEISDVSFTKCVVGTTVTNGDSDVFGSTLVSKSTKGSGGAIYLEGGTTLCTYIFSDLTFGEGNDAGSGKNVAIYADGEGLIAPSLVNSYGWLTGYATTDTAKTLEG